MLARSGDRFASVTNACACRVQDPVVGGGRDSADDSRRDALVVQTELFERVDAARPTNDASSCIA